MDGSPKRRRSLALRSGRGLFRFLTRSVPRSGDARSWRRASLADPIGERNRHSRLERDRTVTLRARRERGWTLSGSLDELSGSEFNEIFAHFIDAEWRTDWREARARLGDRFSTADLCRTAAHRRADALLLMARAGPTGGASAEADSQRLERRRHVRSRPGR